MIEYVRIPNVLVDRHPDTDIAIFQITLRSVAEISQEVPGAFSKSVKRS